MQRGFT
jgi:IS1 family transposase